MSEIELTHEALRDQIVNDIRSRSEWMKKQEQLHLRRMCARPKVKTYPYKGAPNFVVPIIDDAVRERTDQEISMLFNAPSLVHCIPISANTDHQACRDIERAMDSYLRHVIKIRRKLVQLFDTKNAMGLSVAKATRKYNARLQAEIPDIEPKFIGDLIVPPDTEDLASAERIVDVLRLNERQFVERASVRGWMNVDAVKNKARQNTRENNSTDRDYFERVKDLVGIATSQDASYIVVWVIYHRATEYDAAWIASNKPDELVDVGDKIVTVLSPDAADLPLDKYAWREADIAVDIQQPQPDGSIVVMRQITKGAERPWPFVEFTFEERSPLFYDQRGIAELTIDDQIEASASKNAKYVMLEYYQNPMVRGLSRNAQGITFAPGSTFEPGVEFIDPPNIPPQFDFSINDSKASAARRVGAVSMYNYSTDIGSRKLQKSATEAQLQQSNAAAFSSVGVDAFNEQLGKLIALLWADMKRMNLVFPVISQDRADKQSVVSQSIYANQVIIVPASSAKTLNPEVLLNRMLSIAAQTIQFAQSGVIAADPQQIWGDVLAQFDKRMTNNWLLNPDQQQGGLPPIYSILQSIDQKIQLLAKGGQDLQSRIEGLERLSVDTSKQLRALANRKALP